MRKLLVVLCLLILITTVGCSKERNHSSDLVSSFNVSSGITNTESFPYSESNTPSSDDNNNTSNQETGSEASNSTSKPTDINSQTPTESQGTTSGTSNTETPEKKDDEVSSEKAFSKLSFSYTGYNSSNEPKPHLKGKPIYDILYSGKRAQVGDKLSFTVETSPSNATDSLVISTSNNLSYSISGKIITVTVKDSGAYGVGTLSVSSKLNSSLSQTFRITIDAAGNPLNDFSTILGEYIAYKGMTYCTVPKGYTTDNPSLSITNYPGAPAWDDMISRDSDDWMQKSLWLIDEYKKHSMGKVNFVISPTEIGFSASK